MDRSMMQATDDDLDRILQSIAQANLVSPRPSLGASQPSPPPLSLGQPSPYSSPYDPAQQASPSIQFSPSSPQMDASLHAGTSSGGLPPPLILTPDFPPPPPSSSKRVDSTDLWAAAGEAGASSHGVGAFDSSFFRSPGGPPSDGGSHAGGSGYYTPSYASSYGSYQDDGSSFLGDAFDGKLDFLELGDGSAGGAYDPDAEDGGAGQGSIHAGNGLGTDVVSMLEAWGEEQGLFRQERARAPDSAQHPSPGGVVSDEPAAYPSSTGPSPYITAGFGGSPSRSPQYHPPTRTETADTNMTIMCDDPPPSSAYSRPSIYAPAPAHAHTHYQPHQQHPSFASAGHGSSPPTGSPGSEPHSATQRSPPTITIPDAPQASGSGGNAPLDSLPSASSLFPPMDPRLLGLMSQNQAAGARASGAGGPMIEISPATPISGQLQSAVFSETLAALGQRHEGQTVHELDERDEQQQRAQGPPAGGGVKVEPDLHRGSPGNSSATSSLGAASSDVSSNGLYSAHHTPPSADGRYSPHASPAPPFPPPTTAQQSAFYASLGLAPQHLSTFYAPQPPPPSDAQPSWSASSGAAQTSAQGSVPFPSAGQQQGQHFYWNPATIQLFLQQQQQQQRPDGPSAGPSLPLPAAATSAAQGPQHPHLKAPPKRQRSRSDASALPYDFGPVPPAAPTMNPNMLSNLGLAGGAGGGFFPGQSQPMESPSSSPRSMSSALPAAGPSNALPHFNPLPPPTNTMMFNPAFPSYSSFAPGGGASSSDAGGDPLGPRRTSHGSAQRTFGAGTPGYGVGMLHPWGSGGFDPISEGVGVQRSVSDAGKGRKGHRKVQSVDLSYTRPDGTLGVPLAPVRSPRRPSASGPGSSSSRSPARSPTPELRALSSAATDDGDDHMGGGGGSGGSSVGSVTKQSVTTKKTAAASQGRRKTAATFVCPIPGCGSTFTRSFNLKGHLRSHTDERPFKCSTCQKGFARAHDCKRHMALHVGYRPHVCLGCDKRFARLDALSRHLKSEAGQECVRGGKMAAPTDGGSDDGDGSGGDGSDFDDVNGGGGGGGAGKGVLL